MDHPSLWAYARDWFPLIARSRPVCETVEVRLDRLTAAVQRHEEPGATLADTASVLNLAALVASDCGEPTLARSLCWKQFDVLEDAGPLSLDAAKIVFEPIVNLSRLAVRDGRPGDGYAILDDAFEAASSGGTLAIDGRRIDIGRLLADAEALSEARRLLWIALLADGSRALVRAGRWRDAQERAEARSGIGTRLTDGLQVAILADCAEKEYASAADRLRSADLREEWEEAVASWLACFQSVLSGVGEENHVPRMIDAAARIEAEQGQAVFRTRLRLASMSLAEAAGHHADTLFGLAVHDVLENRDAHAALDLLQATARTARGLEPDRRSDLERLLDDARLGRGLDASALDRLSRIAGMAASQLGMRLARL